MKKLHSKGIATVESLLIAIIVLLVVFIGYYVYHSQKKSNADLNQSLKSTQSSSHAQAASPNDNKTPEVFLIPEWHVSATLKPAPKLLIQYAIKQENGQEWAQFSSQELKDLDPSSCSADTSPAAGVINRATASDHLYGGDGTDTGKTILQAVQDGTIRGYTRVGSYYFWYQGPQGLCGGNDQIAQKVAQVQTDTQNAVKAILANLKSSD